MVIEMKRYVSIDFLRGVAIFGMVFLHLLDDLYDFSWTSNINEGGPVIAVLMLLCGIFFGSWAGLFLMVSAMGNMVSMYNNFERGKSVKSILIKQVVGGLILLLFGFLAEGTLQYYGLFQTIRDGTMDFSRIIWKGFTMETIHTIAYCMIINGIIQCFLSINGGHRKIKRNMIIYGIIALFVVLCTQPIWDWVKSIIPGYPFDPFHTGRDLMYPSVGASFLEYLQKFFFLPLAGNPEPIFPFLAVSCIGSILGMAVCREKVSHNFPKKAVFAGFLVIVTGILVWIIGDMPFDSLLPLDDFSMFARIGGGLNWLWLPWVLIITGSQIMFVGLTFRLVEFRGVSKGFANKTRFIRRFGMVPFTIYCFHRTLAMIPLGIISLIFQRDVMIDCHNLNGWYSLLLIAISLIFIEGLLILWERKDYIGSLEWLMATIGAYLLGMPKQSTEKKKWYRWGATDQKEAFYNAEWIDIFQQSDTGGVEYRDSKLAMKISVTGLIAFPATIISQMLVKHTIEQENKYKKIAKRIGIIAAILNIAVIIFFTLFTLSDLGIYL